MQQSEEVQAFKVPVSKNWRYRPGTPPFEPRFRDGRGCLSRFRCRLVLLVLVKQLELHPNATI